MWLSFPPQIPAILSSPNRSLQRSEIAGSCLGSLFLCSTLQNAGRKWWQPRAPSPYLLFFSQGSPCYAANCLTTENHCFIYFIWFSSFLRWEDKSGSFNPLREGAEILIAVLKFIETKIGIKWLLFFLFFSQLLRYPLRLVF